MKLQVPAGEDGDLPVQEGPQVSGQPSRLPLVGAHQHQGAAGVLPEGGGHAGPMDRGQAGKGQGRLPLTQRFR